MHRWLQAEGTLSTQGGDVFPVMLTLTVAELPGTTGGESEEAARVELASPVPDGTYMLDYFYANEVHGSVQVRRGAFVAA